MKCLIKYFGSFHFYIFFSTCCVIDLVALLMIPERMIRLL